LDEETVAGYDCVLRATDHDGVDYSLINKSAQLILDTRGRMKNAENIISA